MAGKPDLSAFLALSEPKRRTCQIALILDELDQAEREQLEAALATDNGIITGAAIVGWLKQRGHETNQQRVSVHRRGLCSCGRS